MLFYYGKLLQSITVIQQYSSHLIIFSALNVVLWTILYIIHKGFLFLLSCILLFKVENDKYYCHVLIFLFCQKSHLYAVLFVFLH